MSERPVFRAMRRRHGAVALAWTLLVAASLAWNGLSQERQTLARARAEAHSAHEKDMAFRLWGIRHGGVYVWENEAALPSPSLAHLPGRDVATADGRRLTLRAPATMVREMAEAYTFDSGVQGRIVGLRQLNPVDNAPDVWEKDQIESFARGEKSETWEIAAIEGKPYLRYLKAWYMTPECETCHAVLGYRDGDLRGATGVNLPLAAHYADLAEVRANLALAHGGIWLVGLYGIGWSGRLERRSLQARLAAEEDMRRLAYTDALTGLPNRASLEIRLAQVLAMVRRENASIAVLFVDLDHFKRINDSLGHLIGDLLLRNVAQRLKDVVRDSDIVARLGGDEYIVVLTGLDAGLDALAVGTKMLVVLAQPHAIGGRSLCITSSIGIALYPQDGATGAELMKNADAAMYAAKGAGRAQVQFYRAEMNAQAERRLMLENDLRTALAAGELELYYQPKVGAGEGCRLQGFEALLRWRHPRHGFIAPTEFIPVAEESGQIEAIGAWVLDAACRQLAVWEKSGVGPIHVAVNLSACQLRAADVAVTVAATLERHGVAPDRIELEVTESTAMSDPERAIERLQALRALGVSLAIDDFGTGYSSLAYLKRLPVQTLKIDKSFVMDIGVDANDTAIVAATLALARSLGLAVVAEGVETVEQKAFLVAHGCSVLQGYLFGKPAPADAWTGWLRNCGAREGESP